MDDLQPADLACAAPVEPFCEPQPLPWQAALCGHTPEDFAAVALALEPRGAAWCKDFGTIKAALYRGFGKLLSDFEQRMCALFKESLACESVELLGEWEFEYGLPGECAVGSYPTDLAGRQAMVCAARRAQGISTMKELEDILKIALDCPHLTLEDFYEHNTVNTHAGMPLTVYGGICVRGIGPVAPVPYMHNVVGGWGLSNCGYCPSAPLLDGGFGYLASDSKDPAATVEIAPCAGDTSTESIWIYPAPFAGVTTAVTDCDGLVIGYGMDQSNCS